MGREMKQSSQERTRARREVGKCALQVERDKSRHPLHPISKRIRTRNARCKELMRPYQRTCSVY